MFRDFRPGDQGAVRNLVLAGMQERWGDDFDPSAHRDLEDIGEEYVPTDALRWRSRRDRNPPICRPRDGPICAQSGHL